MFPSPIKARTSYVGDRSGAAECTRRGACREGVVPLRGATRALGLVRVWGISGWAAGCLPFLSLSIKLFVCLQVGRGAVPDDRQFNGQALAHAHAPPKLRRAASTSRNILRPLPK
jgi:hypothetical protein